MSMQCCAPKSLESTAAMKPGATPAVVSNSPNPESIRTAVREHYTRAAKTPSGCCGDATATLGYETEKLQTVPTEVREASLGCGSPVDAARLAAGEVVVDLGSGAGLDVVLAANAVGETGRVYGVDMTPAMLEKSRDQIARLGLGQVTILEGDIEKLPLEAGVADVVISNCVINLAPDKSRVFAEAYRVLRPGGRIVFADLVRTAPPEAGEVDLSSWSACVAGAVTLEEYAERLRAAGFESVSTTGDREYELRSGGCGGPDCVPGGACCEPGTDCCGDAKPASHALRSVTVHARKPS